MIDTNFRTDKRHCQNRCRFFDGFFDMRSDIAVEINPEDYRFNRMPNTSFVKCLCVSDGRPLRIYQNCFRMLQILGCGAYEFKPFRERVQEVVGNKLVSKLVRGKSVLVCFIQSMIAAWFLARDHATYEKTVSSVDTDLIPEQTGDPLYNHVLIVIIETDSGFTCANCWDRSNPIFIKKPIPSNCTVIRDDDGIPSVIEFGGLQ